MIKKYKQLFFQYLEEAKNYNEKVSNFNIALEKAIAKLRNDVGRNFPANTYATPEILKLDEKLQTLSIALYEDQRRLKELCAKFSKEDASELNKHFPLSIKKEPGDYIDAINQDAYKRYQAEDYEAQILDTPNAGLIYMNAVEEALVKAIHTIFGSSYEGSTQKTVRAEAELVK